MALNIGRRGKLFLAGEAAFGVAETLVATDAVRHIDVGFSWDPFARVTSPEKKLSPGAVSRFDRRSAAAFNLRSALLRPSGTLNTEPELHELLEAAFGTVSNITLDTTFTGTPTATGGSVASATGLAVGQGVLITRNSVNYVRVLTDVAGLALTWAPALPSAPILGEALQGCITYKLTSALAKSLTVAHYLDGFSRQLTGAGIDRLSLVFDGTEEARIVASGPAKDHTTPAQSEPAAFTTVGGNPPTGMVGELYLAATLAKHKTLSIDLTNGLKLRNEEAGGSVPTELYRAARREVTVSLETFAETEANLYDLAEAGTNVATFRQNGRTEGNIIAVYMPRVEYKVPETSDEDEAVNWPFTGMALESADNQNDEITLVLA